MADINTVVWGRAVAKQLDKLPDFIQRKFYAWVTAIDLQERVPSVSELVFTTNH